MERTRSLLGSLALLSSLTFNVPAHANSNLPNIKPGENVSISNASNRPGNLSDLSQNLSKSVVTVYCTDSSGNGSVGSGWAIDINFSDYMKSHGVQSYVITNNHVINDCADGNGTVTLKLGSGASVDATIFARDVEQDVAGIVTTQYLPGLKFQGPTPQQGWWVGVLGSPLNNAGILSEGIVSKVDQYQGDTTASMDHGNSGGPVFDNAGRVLGVASMFLAGNGTVQQGSEHFGVFRGTPMLCAQIINCGDVSNVWRNGSTGAISTSPLTLLLGLLVIAILITGGILLYKRRGGKRYSPTPRTSTFPPVPGGTPRLPAAPTTPATPGLIPPPPATGGNRIPPPPKTY